MPPPSRIEIIFSFVAPAGMLIGLPALLSSPITCRNAWSVISLSLARPSPKSEEAGDLSRSTKDCTGTLSFS